MPPIKNQRQEKFCALYFAAQGTNTPAYECAIAAGYSLKAARQTASRLLTFANIQQRLAEFNKKAEDALIADVVERKKVATEIVRGRLADFIDEGGTLKTDRGQLKSAAIAKLVVTERAVGPNVIDKKTEIVLRNPLDGVDILNKMDNIYKQEQVQTDVKILVIYEQPKQNAPEIRVIEG